MHNPRVLEAVGARAGVPATPGYPAPCAPPIAGRTRLLTADCDSSGTTCRYVLRPNRSLSPRGMVWFVAAVGAAAFLVAIRFVLLGAWIVLPLAIAEIAGLGLAFYLVSRAGRRCEIIDVTETEMLVVRDDGHERQEWRFQPYWVQVILQLDPKNWYPSRLFLRSHGRQLEIGRSLTDAERRELSEELRRRLVQRDLPGDAV